MKDKEIAGRIIAYLRKYEGRGPINPKLFSMSIGCTEEELRSVQAKLLDAGVMFLASKLGALKDYQLTELYKQGDAWMNSLVDSRLPQPATAMLDGIVCFS